MLVNYLAKVENKKWNFSGNLLLQALKIDSISALVMCINSPTGLRKCKFGEVNYKFRMDEKCVYIAVLYFHILAYTPFSFFMSSSCWPISTSLPDCNTRMLSQFLMVIKRWAIITIVFSCPRNVGFRQLFNEFINT